ncbi:hypothetical protein E1264_33590 [Actinomadura sp. KC216]|uniref:hypothetical protein n=1 Tax=Actinomadura sp. KC216 TaxID=2530370 RepID=UPI00104F2CB8|nr:hypothetical protein [Actinomadura sp. KC216]TDB80847.1 hypothetical protein E1264_33590 [Actinomadura sp. KC216]
MKGERVSQIGKRTAMISLAGVAAATALVGTAPSAAATPTGCAGVQVDGQNYESRCTGGTGEHRVWARQDVPFLGVLDCFGPWVPVGSVSRVTCSIHQTVFVTHQTRG